MDVQALLETAYTALGIIDPDSKLRGELPASTTVVSFGGFWRQDRPFIFAERAFTDMETFKATLAGQAANPDDPNPLPVALVRFDETNAVIELESLDYNPVYGLGTGGQALAKIRFGDSKVATVERGAGFLENLFDER